jgi:hypothetical protein
VGAFAISPGGDNAQRAAIQQLLRAALVAATEGKPYGEENGFF